MPEKSTDDWQRTWHHLQAGLGNKWALHVVHVLAEGPAGFSELDGEIDGISETTLSRRLTDLRETNFVEKSTVPTDPTRTRYRLTEAGQRVATFLDEMERITALAETEEGVQLVFET